MRISIYEIIRESSIDEIICESLSIKLFILEKTFAICRFEAATPIPVWALRSSFFSITKSIDEFSIVGEQDLISLGARESFATEAPVKVEKNWRALKIEEPLDFSLTEILASLAVPLSENGICLFAISTFDTDYVLVRAPEVDRACAVLRREGFTF